MSVKERLTEDVLRDRIKAQIERLEKNDLLVYDVTAGFGFNKLLVKINNLHPEYYTIWNENDEGEVANLIKYSSLENVIDWIIKDATSYTPKLLKNKYVKMEEDWKFDNMDIISSSKDIRLHFRIPFSCLVSKVNAGFKKLFH